MKIEIYPKCEVPDWIKVGAKCYVWGEAFDLFTIAAIGKFAVLLNKSNGVCHGWESITKLHKNRED